MSSRMLMIYGTIGEPVISRTLSGDASMMGWPVVTNSQLPPFAFRVVGS